jgi:hypothetical protein
VNGIAVSVLGGKLDEEDSRQDEKSAGQWSETDVAEQVAKQNEHRHQAKTAPTRHAAECFAEAHDVVSRRGTTNYGKTGGVFAVRQVTWTG